MDFFYSDMVFNCTFKNKKVKIALLFEHKSTIPKYPAIQLGGYIYDIMRQAVNKRKQEPIPIIPIIFYHGKTRWTKRKFLDDLGNIDQILKPYIPDFEYHLIDLSVYRNEELMKMFSHKKTRTFMIFFKKDEQYIELHFKELVLNLNIETQMEYFETLCLYLYKTTDINIDYIIETTKEVSEIGGKIAMTTADRLEKKVQIKSAIKMIKKGYPIEDIIDITELSKKEIQDLMSKYKN